MMLWTNGRSRRTCRFGCAPCRRQSASMPPQRSCDVEGGRPPPPPSSRQTRANSIAVGAIGFVKIARRESDPPKPHVSPEGAAALFRGHGGLARPLREEAGIHVVNASMGEVQMEVTPVLRNPAGTLQGAMVALLAEAATEEFVSTRFDSPALVTDLDLRYLAQAQVGPLRTRCRALGTGPDAPIQVELIDTSVDRITTLVYARAMVIS